MKYVFVLFLGLLVSAGSHADTGTPVFCGDVKRMYTWVNGNDEYGVRVQFSENPSDCAGGFYLPQLGNNRDKVYSFLLAAKASKTPVCIQTDLNYKISNRCLIHYVADHVQ